MNRLLLLTSVLLVLAGCAWFTQKQADVALSNATPLTNTETVTTQQQAATIGSTVSSLPIPFAPIAGTVVTFIAGWFLAANRGAAIRKTGTVPVKTTTNVNLWTGLVQDISNAFAGAFTTTTSTTPSTSSTVWQRIWKTLLATVVSGGAAIAADPSLTSLLIAHPIASGILTTVPAIILGIEKALSNVPVVTTIAPVAPVA